jgi:hypothetical protein
MKTVINKKSVPKALTLFLCMVFLLSCDTSSTSNNNQSTINTIVSMMSSGTWRITYYFDSNQDETSDYAGYNFTFGANNVLTASNGANNYTGFWSVTRSSSGGSSLSDLDFNILFTAPPFMAELSDDWDIISATSTEIKLIDVSGGGGGTDYLTFTKN